MSTTIRLNKGFSTAINLMALMTFALIFGLLVLPSREEVIRAHVSQGLQQADMAKTALAAACRGNSARLITDNADAGYFFIESKYVANIQLSADCAAGTMGIRVRTQNTGASPDPEILLISGAEGGPDGQPQPEWRCGLATGNAEHVPEDCRSHLSFG